MYKALNLLKKFLICLLVLILILLLIFIILNLNSIKKINEIKKFTSEEVKVLYITDNNNYSDYPIELFNKYEVNYMHINISSLSFIEKRSLKKLINNKYLNNIIVIFKNGKIEDAIIGFDSKESLNTFLQNNNIIPKIIGKIDGIIDEVVKYKLSDLTILYIPYNYINGIDGQNKILTDICNTYEIKYDMINAYLLSEFQKQKLNSILDISYVNDQIVVIIKDKKVVGNIRGVKSKEEYLKIINEYNLREEYVNNFINIDYPEISNKVLSPSKSVILISDDKNTGLNKLLSKVSNENNFQIYYSKILEENFNDFENDLLKLGYDLDITIPMVLVVESGNILNYSMGLSSEEYFIQMFKESGIIK